MATIPHLHTDRNGLVNWQDVPVGAYRIITLHDGALAGKDVLVQKRKDNSAQIHLEEEKVQKSHDHSIAILTLDIPEEERKENQIPLFKSVFLFKSSAPVPPLPTQISHFSDMHGNPHYVPMHGNSLSNDSFPVGAKLPSGMIRTRNGYIHSLPQNEKMNADNGHGSYTKYPSLGLPSVKKRDGLYNQPFANQDYRGLQDMDDSHARDALHEHLRQNGATPSFLPEHDLMLPSPTGDWYHFDTKSTLFPQKENGTQRHDVIPHIASAVMNPAEVWEHGNDEYKQRTHSTYPVPEGDEKHFPNGVVLHASTIARGSGESPNHYRVTHIDTPSDTQADWHRQGRPIYLQHHHGDEK